MEHAMSSDSDPRVKQRRTRLLLGSVIAALVVAFVILHLTGVLGPS
jgi:hypothetical protein